VHFTSLGNFLVFDFDYSGLGTSSGEWPIYQSDDE
jgi:hypothetical protein